VSEALRKLVLVAVCVVTAIGGATLAIASKGGGTSNSNAADTQYGTGGQGCTPGFWKQNHPNTWVGYKTTDTFDSVFGVTHFGSLTLLEAAALGGGGFNALARHATAALLNASNPSISYDLSVAEIIKRVQEAFKANDPEPTKNVFEAFNESSCSIDAHGEPGKI
jgi:hypothetical protein